MDTNISKILRHINKEVFENNISVDLDIFKTELNKTGILPEVNNRLANYGFEGVVTLVDSSFYYIIK